MSAGARKAVRSTGGRAAATPSGGFAGFAPAGLAFFAGLEADNSRTFFEANRAAWEADVRAPVEMLLGELSLREGGTVKMFRQHRDVRFSRDKSPYKTNCYGIIHSRPGRASALYASISARGLYAASGYHEMAADQLARFREAVADDETGPALAAAVAGAVAVGLELGGEALKGVPRGFRADHPRADLLRWKALFAGAQLVPGPELHDRRALEWVARVWAAADPLCAWLDAHIGESEIPPEIRYGGGRSRR